MIMQPVQIPEISSVPAFEALESGVRTTMREADAALGSVSVTRIDAWIALLSHDDNAIQSEEFANFEPFFSDPLTETYRAYHDLASEEAASEPVSHSAEQMSELEAYAGQLDEQIRGNDFAGFLSGLEALSSVFLGRRSTYRDCPVYLARDIRGAYVEFPSHAAVTAQLSRCFDTLCDDTSATVYRAVVAYVTIIGAHPFYDGNGRLARLLFNAVLVNGGLSPDSFIPVKEVHRISRGGVSVRLRRAMVRGTWDGIFESLTHAVFLTAYINNRQA